MGHSGTERHHASYPLMHMLVVAWVSCNYAVMLLLVVLHRSLLKPLPLMASRPQFPPASPMSLSNLPTSFPHPYPALKLIAENTSTTPAEIIQYVKVGLITSSDETAFADRSFFACRSLLDSLDRRFICLGDRGLDSSDSGTNLKLVGWVGRVVDTLSGAFCSSLGRTAAAQERRVVNDALNAAS